MPKTPPKPSASAFLRDPKFSQWLYYQRDRADSIGGLARFAEEDSKREGTDCWPYTAKTVGRFVAHLRHEHKGDKSAPAEATLLDAFDEFRRFRKSGGKVPARLGGPRVRSNNVDRGFKLPAETVVQIQELAEMLGLAQGEVLAKVVARAHAQQLRRASS
jgi:hypothetical protein